MSENQLVFPGTILGVALDYKPGRNTYVHRGKIVASVVGRMEVDSSSRTCSVSQKRSQKACIRSQEGFHVAQSAIEPFPGQEVVGRINKVNANAAFMEIMQIEGRQLAHTMHGSIRFDEVRSTTTRVPMIELFRPGDTVCAQIMSLSDPRCYVLSALEANNGVIAAVSEFGFPLEVVPNEIFTMRCTGTSAIEKRLVAQP